MGAIGIKITTPDNVVINSIDFAKIIKAYIPKSTINVSIDMKNRVEGDLNIDTNKMFKAIQNRFPSAKIKIYDIDEDIDMNDNDNENLGEIDDMDESAF